jgi:hypothetical protein
MTERTFTDSVAVRGNVPLLIGLVGPSSSGKTLSALRLATGIQRVVGGDIYCVDTEANRALHYADSHKFRHVPFTAPFDPLSYLAAVEHCAKKGAKTIIIDSASHLHEGPGGVLEMHESECARLMAAWQTTREKVQMAAWQKPKSDLRKFLNAVLQMQVNTIWAFRAKEKLKIIPGQPPKPLGFMPISGDEMIYDMTLNCLLYPNSGGVPSWHPEEMGERATVKLPEQFKDIFREVKPLDEDIGEQLARWAAGTRTQKALSPDEVEKYSNLMNHASSMPELQAAFKIALDAASKLKDPEAQKKFVQTKDLRKAALEAAPRE